MFDWYLIYARLNCFNRTLFSVYKAQLISPKDPYQIIIAVLYTRNNYDTYIKSCLINKYCNRKNTHYAFKLIKSVLEKQAINCKLKMKLTLSSFAWKFSQILNCSLQKPSFEIIYGYLNYTFRNQIVKHFCDYEHIQIKISNV